MQRKCEKLISYNFYIKRFLVFVVVVVVVVIMITIISLYRQLSLFQIHTLIPFLFKIFPGVNILLVYVVNFLSLFFHQSFYQNGLSYFVYCGALCPFGSNRTSFGG
jgi:uncharacterized membrane protein